MLFRAQRRLLISLGWSESLLGTHVSLLVLSCSNSFMLKGSKFSLSVHVDWRSQAHWKRWGSRFSLSIHVVCRQTEDHRHTGDKSSLYLLHHFNTVHNFCLQEGPQNNTINTACFFKPFTWAAFILMHAFWLLKSTLHIMWPWLLSLLYFVAFRCSGLHVLELPSWQTWNQFFFFISRKILKFCLTR